MPRKASAEIVVPMAIDVDGAPNSYGRNNAVALFCRCSARTRNQEPDGICKTGSVLDLWNRAARARGVTLLRQDDALNDPSKVSRE